MRGAAWLADFETELLQFPMGAHDDRVDNVSMAVTQIRKSSSGMIFDFDDKSRVKNSSQDDIEYEDDDNMVFWR